ncbi:MAG: hypothetical protein M3Y32_03915 [Pseudomonadota bacterium]|nr:hypothetical protein [Pseudomonadota bacterium]
MFARNPVQAQVGLEANLVAFRNARRAPSPQLLRLAAGVVQ